MTSGASSTMPAPSECSRLYGTLLSMGFKHWEIRTLLLHRLGFSRQDIRPSMKRGRRRIRERDENLISWWIANVATLDAEQQARWIMRQAWPDDGDPLIEWATVSDAIRRLNHDDKDGTRRRWCIVDRLRRHEHRNALQEWEDRAIGAYLRLGFHQ